jgi:hypothetical protein
MDRKSKQAVLVFGRAVMENGSCSGDDSGQPRACSVAGSPGRIAKEDGWEARAEEAAWEVRC